MHSPMYMYETEVQDRVNSYHWQAELASSDRQGQDGWASSWLDTMRSNLGPTLSYPAAAARRTVAEIRSWMAKPPAPQEQCC